MPDRELDERQATVYEIAGRQYVRESPGFADAVELAYASRRRPRCMCHLDGIEMYIAKLGDGFLIKRMPETGCQHNPGCPSFESTEDASGRGALLASAIHEDPRTGLTALRLDFSLSTSPGRSTTHSFDAGGASSRNRGTRLSMRGLLHYFWDQAGLTRWQPGFSGRRTWPVVRHRLRSAAACSTVSGQMLLDRLYVPEAFSVGDGDAICARREAHWAAAGENHGKHRTRMLMIAELKEMAAARHGFKAVVKHAPDLGFMLDERLFRQIGRRFESQLTLWSSADDVRMVMIATFTTSPGGVPLLAEVSLMPTTRDWLPVDSAYEKLLIGHLVAEDRRFIKGLRYDLPSQDRIATATLTDCGAPAPLLYISSEPSDEASNKPRPEPAGDRRWQWFAHEERMPPLPLPTSRREPR